MYSVVLMMALSSGGEAPAMCFGGRGCNGCSGWSGCHSSCKGGGGLFGRKGCNGGGCYSSGYGCHGGGYGCSGYGGGYGCHGGGMGYACHGGGMGYACHGSGHGGIIYSCTGGCWGGHPHHHMDKDKDKDKDKGKDPKIGSGTGTGEVNAPATIVVNLPADAKLTIDDNLTTSTSGTRVFVSPALTPGKEFHYTLKAEVVRDGKTLVKEERITVRAGGETRVRLEPEPVASVASK